MLPTRVEIPTGLTTIRMIGRIPIEAGILLALLVAVPWIVFHNLWTFLLAVPIWSFFRWHARKDPLFLRLWAGQMRFKRYYAHG
jgi:type IV secretory pathway VirB3-like protein